MAKIDRILAGPRALLIHEPHKGLRQFHDVRIVSHPGLADVFLERFLVDA
jgi:hypothetical protein